MTSPYSSQLTEAVSAVGRMVSSLSISKSVSSASFRLLVTKTAGELYPCSAWPSKSVAHNSASTVSSAITMVSVGPANKSIPTRPNNCLLASATKALPGPTSISTESILAVPRAIAPTA